MVRPPGDGEKKERCREEATDRWREEEAEKGTDKKIE